VGKEQRELGAIGHVERRVTAHLRGAAGL
jgi:hypothetical protein